MRNVLKKTFLVIMILIAIYKVASSSQTRSDSLFSAKNKIVKSFELYQNEPERFRQITCIKFDIYNEGSVSLKVYDSNGQLIETLAEGEMQPGKYNVYFKASQDLNRGEYYYKLEMNGKTQVRTMVKL